MSEQEEVSPSPRIYVFYSRTCATCRKKLGLALDGVTEQEQTNLTKALRLFEIKDFEIVKFDISIEQNKAQLLSATAKGDAFLPVLITPFAILENPPIASISDLIDALRGLKHLVPEEGHEKVA